MSNWSEKWGSSEDADLPATGAAASLRKGVPMITVILVAGAGLLVDDVMRRLMIRCARAGAELIVVGHADVLEATRASESIGLRLLLAPARTSSDELRELGMRYARGDIITILDTSSVDADERLVAVLSGLSRKSRPASTSRARASASGSFSTNAPAHS